MSSSRLILSDHRIVLPPVYLGSTAYYALLASHRHVAVANAMRWDKRKKYVHRCEIVDTRHRIFLTVPVAKAPMPQDMSRADRSPLRWNDIAVSAHDDWWDLHRVALESAYGRTPFFEHYAPRLLPLIGEERVGRPVTELTSALDTVIRDILHLDDTDVQYLDDPAAFDDREVWLPPYPAANTEYYQIRADRLGFQPGLSILDLIFNCGPESPLVLRDMMLQTV